MVENKFKNKENNPENITTIINLVKKVMKSGFGEVVVKVQDGKIVLLEEKFTYKPDERMD